VECSESTAAAAGFRDALTLGFGSLQALSSRGSILERRSCLQNDSSTSADLPGSGPV